MFSVCLCILSKAMEAARQRATAEKNQLAVAYQDLLSLKGTLEREIEMLKGRRVLAGGTEVSVWKSDAILCKSRGIFEVFSEVRGLIIVCSAGLFCYQYLLNFEDFLIDFLIESWL